MLLLGFEVYFEGVFNNLLSELSFPSTQTPYMQANELGDAVLVAALVASGRCAPPHARASSAPSGDMQPHACLLAGSSASDELCAPALVGTTGPALHR